MEMRKDPCMELGGLASLNTRPPPETTGSGRYLTGFIIDMQKDRGSYLTNRRNRTLMETTP
jgi:hypothetical protein